MPNASDLEPQLIDALAGELLSYEKETMQIESIPAVDHIATATPAALLLNARQHRLNGDLAQAEQCYRAVLSVEPTNVEALYRLALLFHRGELPAQEALAMLDTAVALQPWNPALYRSRASVLLNLERQVEALESLGEACCLAPADLDSLYNVGLLCAELCCPAQAEVYARRLLVERPDWAPAHYLLVRALTALEGDLNELEARYDQLVKSDPLNSSLRFARGLLQLRMGNYRQGWDAQEWRWDLEPVKSSHITCPQPRWSGGPLTGRRLLIVGEQGFGDVLQFVRYLPLLIERGAQVTLRLDANRAALVPLLSRIKGLTITVEPEELPDCDLYCPLASLPYVFGTTLQNIPQQPYLQVDPQDVEAWRKHLARLPRPWTGVCWAGSPTHSHNIRRSLSLCPGSRYHAQRQEREQRIGAVAARLAEALDLPGLTDAAQRDALPASLTFMPLLQARSGSFISLQIGPHADDIDELPAALRSRMTSPLTAQSDYYETACLVQALDEVVTVDTSVAHLAGALGQRTLVIKPAAPEWRWTEDQGRSVWYPSMTLMEQKDLLVP